MAPRCLDPSSPAGSRMSSSSQPPGLRPTPMRIEAIKHGARGATLCEVTEDCLCVGGILGDLECDRVGRRLGTLLSKAEEMRIRTPSGTDIKGKVAGRPIQYETGLFREPGQFAAIPDSEINISPIEGTAEGIVIADVHIMQLGVTREEPVEIIVSKGEIKDIKGGVMARSFLRKGMNPSLSSEIVCGNSEISIAIFLVAPSSASDRRRAEGVDWSTQNRRSEGGFSKGSWIIGRYVNGAGNYIGREMTLGPLIDFMALPPPDTPRPFPPPSAYRGFCPPPRSSRRRSRVRGR